MKRYEDTEKTIWLNRIEAAEHMRLSPATPPIGQASIATPDYVRIGQGRVHYRMGDIDSWMENQAKRAS